jgi:site-specific DNA-cytosine methylase
VSDVYGYDEYNDSITEQLHHSLRAGTRQSNGVVHPVDIHLFEPMSMREENWAESDVKNALRAGASKSSHAVVDTEAWSVSFRGREGGMTAEQGEQGVANTIRAGQGGSVRPHVLISNGPVGTLTADMGAKMQVNNQSVDNHHLQVFKEGDTMAENGSTLVVRRLTPTECELLMGWDAGWTEVGVTEDGKLVEMADTHRYRMCGNGVVANVAEWFGARYVAAKTAE